ncbi:dTDP-4-dehydrorhamnose reductase [Schlesneria paludicola]|uniref:dTDP-4-dehydrorhamnose reductase n=1 Tax=Schlesneria paludicola TaxID=360056 RepID=UPI00029AB18F|nr:dTDP-4-dehydrorhamnose reductase [Schlesneria paludicola]
MRVAVIGAMGQLGSALVDQLGSKAISLGRTDIDITNANNIWSTLDHERPDVVVNCAAYNFVDKAETEREAAMLVNRRGPGFLADYCRERDLKFIHISTDYVYDGRNGQQPWTEQDEASPISTYACSKHAGEQLVRTHCPRHFVVRTCGLYGRASAKGKGNFVETILRLAKERPELRVVGDQLCTPTSTLNLASALIDLMQTDAYGLYHATNSGSCSWADFATEIIRYNGLNSKVVSITTEEYGARARRPTYSVLDCSKLTGAINWAMPPWRDALTRYLSDRDRRHGS